MIWIGKLEGLELGSWEDPKRKKKTVILFYIYIIIINVKTEKQSENGMEGYGVKAVVTSFCRQSDSTCSSETGCLKYKSIN